MFVLMDIEWIENQIHYITPTQIAAMRVDEQWRCHNRFYSRIRPRDSSFHQWTHMAYTGAAGRRPQRGGVSRNADPIRADRAAGQVAPHAGASRNSVDGKEERRSILPPSYKKFSPEGLC